MPVLDPVRPTFRALARTIVPETAALDEADWDEVEAIVEDALAKLADPDHPVVALAGDGAFLMTGLELLTASTYDVGIAVLVLRDRELAQIAQIQGTAFNRKTASEVHDYDLGALCAGFGIECLALEDDDGIDASLAEAAAITARGRPVVVDVNIDYSRKTYFTRGIVKTNLKRLPWKDRLRFVGRAVGRRITEH